MPEVPIGATVITPPSGILQVGASPATLLPGRTGYVALLDVLGFRGMIANDRDNTAVLTYLGALERCLENTGIEGIVFSDSIV